MRVPDALFSKEQSVLNHKMDSLLELRCVYVLSCTVFIKFYIAFYAARLVEANVKYSQLGR